MSGGSLVKMIVGLGNPGAQYESTRHNVGFSVADNLKQRLDRNGSWKKRGEALYCEVPYSFGKLFIIKPQTFMNLSGKAVAEFQRFYKVELADLVVVHDDVDLPVGRIRVKAGGGDAGHNGLKSIRACIGSGDYVRVRCGVGHPERNGDGDAMVSWVLGRFPKSDAAVVAAMYDQAAEAALMACERGLQQTQREFNQHA